MAAWRALARAGSTPGTTQPMQPIQPIQAVSIHFNSVHAEQRGPTARPPSPYAVTFPQGIIWAVLACAATFAVSLVEERKRGTLLRLAVAPVSRLTILAGKAGACLVAIVIMQLTLVMVAVLGFGVRPQSVGLLALALACTALGFVGVMALLAVIGRRTHSAAGMSWAILMGMAMLGGGMLPLFLMPSWLQAAANASPVAWALLAIEGAVWRGSSLAEIAPACAGLLALGGVSLGVGARAVKDL
ncbi:ABC transporter permease [Enhygromyxa salina]